MKARIFASLISVGMILSSIQTPVSAKSNTVDDVPIYHSDPDMIVTYRGYDNFATDSNKKIVLYDFADRKETGVGRDGQSYFSRMYYGLSAYVENNRIYIKVYNDYINDFDIELEELYIESDIRRANLECNSKTKIINCENQDEGLYMITAEFSNDTETCLAFYIDDDFVTLCSHEIASPSKIRRFNNRREIIANLLDDNNIIPEEETDFENACYPWSDKIGHNNEVSKWKELSHEITNDRQSNSQKLFAIHEWMCENLAYDYFRLQYLNAQRAVYEQDFSGRYDTYQTGVGVCFDWVNILAIMCREQNIPCITLDNLNHTWNLVYVNGNWIEIDMTMDIKNCVLSEDMHILKASDVYCYDGFGSMLANSQEPLFVNDALWTHDKALGIEKTQTSQYKLEMRM